MRDNSVKYLFRADYDYNGGNIECKDSNSDAIIKSTFTIWHQLKI